MWCPTIRLWTAVAGDQDPQGAGRRTGRSDLCDGGIYPGPGGEPFSESCLKLYIRGRKHCSNDSEFMQKIADAHICYFLMAESLFT